MRTSICLLMVVCLVVGAGAAWAVGREEAPRNVVLIGWDGAQRGHVRECLERGELPALARLAQEGALVAIDIPRVTDTKAGWTQILTGYEPEVTGVFSNGRYQPIPKGYSIFERLEQHFGANGIATVAVIGKQGHVDADGPQRVAVTEQPRPAAGRPRQQRQQQRQQARQAEGALVTRDGKQYRETPGKPYFYTKDGMDVWLNGLGANDSVGAKALELLEQYRGQRFFFFVHFADVDHKGHASGENSAAYNDALISSDAWTGKIVEKLKELGLYEQTLVYVTADHGFDEGRTSHQDAPYVFLATNDPQVVRRGERVDITPTILDRFGLDLGKLDPPLDGHSLLRPYQPPIW